MFNSLGASHFLAARTNIPNAWQLRAFALFRHFG
jgi:hypothetical protein